MERQHDRPPDLEAPAPRAARTRRRTRIQRENEARILDAALDVFSLEGFRGATLDEIAARAGMSKPNLLYYFRRKEDVHAALLESLLDDWLEPLRALSPDGDPQAEIRAYLRRKLDMARARPRESRLFAAEVMNGAPRIGEVLGGALRALVDEKAQVIRGWMAAGRMRRADPHHLIFAIWATTQHYADFDVQVRLVLGVEGDGHVDDAARFLEDLFRRGLAPEG
ncbi:MAG: TetR family transcriptional regulator C-terminal domain-containing protein [Pseudomonadota bacterium]